MAITGSEGILLLVARILFGAVLAFMGLNHFMQPEGLAGYAEAKGLPAPKLVVYLSGLLLLLGGLGIVVGVYPAAGGAAIAVFLLTSAVTVHNFWAVPEDQAQDQMTHFLKNVAMAGGALGFAAIASQEWAYSVGLGLF